MAETIIVSLVVSALVAFFVSRSGSGPKQTAAVQEAVLTKNLAITDENGKTRMLLRASDKGAGVLLTDKDGKMRVFLRIEDSTGPLLSFHDANENPRAVIGAYEDGAKLEFAGPDGKLRVSVGEDKGDSGVKVYNNKGDKRAALVLNDTFGKLSGPYLAMWDDNLKLRLLLAVHMPGPYVRLDNEDGRTGALLAAVGPLPFLALYHPEESDDPSKIDAAWDLMLKGIKEGRSQGEIREIFRQGLEEAKRGSKLEKSVFISPAGGLRGGNTSI